MLITATPDLLGVHVNTCSGAGLVEAHEPASALVPLVVPLNEPPAAGSTIGAPHVPVVPDGVGVVVGTACVAVPVAVAIAPGVGVTAGVAVRVALTVDVVTGAGVAVAAGVLVGAAVGPPAGPTTERLNAPLLVA